MNIKISINMKILSILNEFEDTHAENKSQLRQDLLYKLVDLAKNLPYPASGQTYHRWQMFAQIAGYDLSLAKLFESHCDALSILNELGYQAEIDNQTWAVWAAEGGPVPIQVENNHCSGIKTWCSGAEFIQKALMSYRYKQGQAQLCIVELAHPSVQVDLSHWQAVGMRGTQTAQVHFDNTPVTVISQPNRYLERPGFWHGAAGVAACWYGAAVRLVGFLHESCKLNPNAFKKMYLGELAQQLSVTKQYFQYIAKLIDDEPMLSHEREIRILRAQTEQCCQSVLQIVGKALGARPYCEEAIFSQLIADLPVFIRQSHAAFDYESIAELCLSEKSLWEL
ncbi:acyl-CoA dehydrogenase [Acinetobacter seifertii]|uniref:acyl-CoA dehydrogenase n=1 Tax=Acinetobacter seifertii TaxID=1530123 RepID=UPI00168D56B9|nr:acyl-CoA dehydrogenase [Acinetobacter seifertii]QNW95846.1 acyl-CoA dehydrogenase [Acinetobacter seifertii]QNX02961.1 acyl-CoA dehydrogenase [Acinetobacter seifertii]